MQVFWQSMASQWARRKTAVNRGRRVTRNSKVQDDNVKLKDVVEETNTR